jgi:hypothetical protein
MHRKYNEAHIEVWSPSTAKKRLQYSAAAEAVKTLYRRMSYIYIYMSYRTANLQTLHFKYFFNKYPC